MQYVHQLPAGFSCVTTLTMSFLAKTFTFAYSGGKLISIKGTAA